MANDRTMKLLLLGIFFATSAVCQSGGGVSAKNQSPRVIDGELVYRAGKDVSTPKPKSRPLPRGLKIANYGDEHTCILWLIVGTDGRPRDIRVARLSGRGKDERAVEAVKKWQFEPAIKDNQPVASEINVAIMEDE